MKLVELKCNNCAANLELDLDNLQAFCPYCGQKLLIDIDQLGVFLAERERTRRAVELEKQRNERKKMEYDYSIKKSDRNWLREILGWGIGITFCIIVLFVVTEYMVAGERKEHKQKVEQLKQLEVEIEEAINEENYEIALIKAGKMYCDDHWSTPETEAWNAKRENYISIIKEKKREQDLNNPEMIAITQPASAFGGRNYTEVLSQLENLGFDNITAEATTESTGLFTKKNSIVRLSIGGKSDFSADDYFKKSAPIILYYYSK